MTDRTGLRLMAVHAHPDDESSKGAATTARYAAQGVDVLVVSLHRGRARQRAQPELPARGARATRWSRCGAAEMAAAAAALGVRQHWLGFVDSGLPEGDPLPPLPDGLLRARPRSRRRPRRWWSWSAPSVRT